jgi:protease-4
VLCDPAGGLRLVGLRISRTHFRGTLDKLGIRAEVVKIGAYKSAPEALTDTGPSEASRRQTEEMLDDVYGRLVETLARARGLAPAAMRERIDRGPYTAKEALAARLVDELVHEEDLDEWLDQRHGTVRFEEPDPGTARPHHWAHLPRIAVIVLEGELVSGESRSVPLLGVTAAGAETLAQAIEEARDDPSIRALIVRVNSPGGVATAADRLWRELMKTRAEKPVIASFGDVAASGGYYVGAAAHRVFAAPSTITGSIGIFYGKLDVSGLLGKLGITQVAFERGQRAGIEAASRPWTDEERAVLQDKIAQFYGRFLDVVAKGRDLPRERVDAAGQGRVWTGAQALRQGLVDELGGFDAAVDEAKRRAGIAKDQPVELVVVPELPASLAERLLAAELRARAAARAALFSWDRAADETVSLYRSLA